MKIRLRSSKSKRSFLGESVCLPHLSSFWKNNHKWSFLLAPLLAVLSRRGLFLEAWVNFFEATPYVVGHNVHVGAAVTKQIILYASFLPQELLSLSRALFSIGLPSLRLQKVDRSAHTLTFTNHCCGNNHLLTVTDARRITIVRSLKRASSEDGDATTYLLLLQSRVARFPGRPPTKLSGERPEKGHFEKKYCLAMQKY